MTAGAEVRDGKQAWRLLRTDPDYVADWRAHSAAPVVEAAPFPFRRQTAADLEAARWNLLAWEDPRFPARASSFWAGADGKCARHGPGEERRGCAAPYRAQVWGDVYRTAATRRDTRLEGVAGPQGGADQGDRWRSLRPKDKRSQDGNTDRWIPPQAVGTASRVWTPSSYLVSGPGRMGDGIAAAVARGTRTSKAAACGVAGSLAAERRTRAAPARSNRLDPSPGSRAARLPPRR